MLHKTSFVLGKQPSSSGRDAQKATSFKTVVAWAFAASPDQQDKESTYFWASLNEKIFLSLYFLELNALFIKKGRIFIFREVPIQALQFNLSSYDSWQRGACS
ncbi:MAG TPA: hypothetical protein VG488_03080 [Candidatus Angelobacter sp.]|jgi:hypothetical protein|nr:hypothetical protein [Candidatus Angelobacter sp.]